MKSDASQIRAFLNTLAEQDWIRRTERRVWPMFAFHYTDIQNAVRILRAGALHSRDRAESTGQLAVSSGSGDVLDNTEPWIKGCVRLYFRPKTPTQYYAEGVKSPQRLSGSRFPDAHCPVPVFFLFELAHVLSIDASRFSDKGLGSHNYQLFSTARELQTLRWQDIYSSGPINMKKPTARNVMASRNAEIVVPDTLPLDSLKFIYCCSPAEHESLMHLLPAEVLTKYRGRIISSPRSAFFYREDTYLENVRLEAKSVVLSFSPDSRSPGPFTLRVQFESLSGDTLQHFDIPDFQVRTSSGGYKWRLDPPASEYELRAYLGSALIYANRHVDLDVDIPF